MTKTTDDVRTELIGLLAEEFVAGGIDCSIVAPTRFVDGTTSPAQVTVPLPADRAGRIPVVHAYFLPVQSFPAVLQYMIVFEFEVAPSAAITLARVLAAINAELPLTGFEMDESSGLVVFRHTHAVSTEPLDPGVVAWTLEMIEYAVSRYGPIVEATGSGLGHAAALELVAARRGDLGDT